MEAMGRNEREMSESKQEEGEDHVSGSNGEKGGGGRKETKEEREGLWTRDKRSNHRRERETKHWKDLRLIRANVTHGSEVVIYGRK